MVQQTVTKFGRLDGVVANAGLMEMLTLEGTTEEDFDRNFGINVKGPFFLAQVYIHFYLTFTNCVFNRYSLCVS